MLAPRRHWLGVFHWPIGSSLDLASAVRDVVGAINQDIPDALGLEAPMWTPRRNNLNQFMSRRLGSEITFKRA